MLVRNELPSVRVCIVFPVYSFLNELGREPFYPFNYMENEINGKDQCKFVMDFNEFFPQVFISIQ